MGLSASQLDVALARCAAEQIHRTPLIQPQGALIICEPTGPWVVKQVSSNICMLHGIGPSDILGQPLAKAFEHNALNTVINLFNELDHLSTAVGYFKHESAGSTEYWIAHAFYAGDDIALEIQPVDSLSADKNPGNASRHLTKEFLDDLDRHPTLPSLLARTVQRFQELTDFDRVMIYQFDDDYTGEIVAEACAVGVEGFLGFHFPASDIPPQARELYLLNKVRILSDVDAENVSLLPAATQSPDQTPDLSLSALRAMSDVHLTYLRNMGVAATLTVSLIVKGKLWGLISCHHLSPKRLSIELRETASSIGNLLSSRIDSITTAELLDMQTRAMSLHSSLLTLMTSSSFQTALESKLPSLVNVVNADGVAVIVDGKCIRHGQTPDPIVINSIGDWLIASNQANIFITDNLNSHFDSAAIGQLNAAGLIAARHDAANMILWFRSERFHERKWAGRYDDGLHVDSNGMPALTPRTSFAVCVEQWSGYSKPWTDTEQQIARMIGPSIPSAFAGKRNLELMAEKLEYEQRALEQRVHDRTCELSEATKIAQSASEAKTSFLATMSHEIRTPMNAIIGTAHLLASSRLDNQQRQDVEVIRSASRSLLSLLNDVLDFSKIEANQLSLESVNFSLDDMLEDVRVMFSSTAAAKGLKLSVNRCNLTTKSMVKGDESRIRQMLINLVSNAVKFTSSGLVTLSVTGEDNPTDGAVSNILFEVSDTGPGLSEAQLSCLFHPFVQADSSINRLHGGSGLGLAIVDRISKLMGGNASVKSIEGVGSTFSISVPLEFVDSVNQRRSTFLRPWRIVIADPDVNSRKMLMRSCGKFGWDVEECISINALVDYLTHTANNSRNVDCLLFGFGREGIDQFAGLLSPDKRPPLIALNNNLSKPLELMLGLIEPDSLLSLPVDADMLFDTVSSIVESRAAQSPAQKPVEENATNQSESHSNRLEGMRVLVVDDSPINLKVVSRLLKKQGAQVEVVESGKAAIDRLTSNSQHFDVVLMDVQMPELDGCETTIFLRSELGLKLPIIALTAGVTADERSRALASGMDDFLGKPVDPDKLARSLLTFSAHQLA